MTAARALQAHSISSAGSLTSRQPSFPRSSTICLRCHALIGTRPCTSRLHYVESNLGARIDESRRSYGTIVLRSRPLHHKLLERCVGKDSQAMLAQPTTTIRRHIKAFSSQSFRRATYSTELLEAAQEVYGGSADPIDHHEDQKPARVSKTTSDEEPSQGPSSSPASAHESTRRRSEGHLEARSPQPSPKLVVGRQPRLRRIARKRKEQSFIDGQLHLIRSRQVGNGDDAALTAFKQWVKELSSLERKGQSETSLKATEDVTWFIDHDNRHALRETWAEMDEARRQELWPTVMLSTLRHQPRKAVMVLHATLEPLPPGYAIRDVVLFAARRLNDGDQQQAGHQQIARADEMLNLLSHIIDHAPADHVPFDQQAFALLARKFPKEHVGDLLDILQQGGVLLRKQTLLHFARCLADDMRYKPLAFKILQDLVEGRGIQMVRPSMLSVITALLHNKSPQDGPSAKEDQFSPKDALQWFMEKGLVPNIINLTAMLDAICRRHGQVEEAGRLFSLFAESGMKLDQKAFATLFRSAKASMNAANIEMALEVAKVSDVDEIEVLNNCLHAVFQFAEEESRQKHRGPPWSVPLFEPLLRLYAKRFDLAPLQQLLPDSLPIILMQLGGGPKFEPDTAQEWDFHHSVVPAVEKLFGKGSHDLLQPDTTTLATMLRAYIKSLRNPQDIVVAYLYFKSILENQSLEPNPAADMVESQATLIHDTFLMTMLEQEGLTRQALQVFGDMLKGHLQATRLLEGGQEAEDQWSGSSAMAHPPPNVFSFTILLRGLFAQKESTTVNQIIRLAKAHGIRQNLVYWNTLVKGYASMQQVPKTISSLQQLESAGFQPDAHTFRAFGWLRNQAAALQKMEKIIDDNTKNMTATWT